ncbi:hypothetical protein [Streptomyces sp. NRRL WC-3742]|nr:hypothetical protein [Streptomyces sp. NRRL WC-3742]
MTPPTTLPVAFVEVADVRERRPPVGPAGLSVRRLREGLAQR